MRITQDNIGDIIRMNQPPCYIQVEAVSDQFVQMLRENGDRYATFSHDIEGSVLQDPARRDVFHYNSILGAALRNAEIGATRTLLNRRASRMDREDAYSVLKSVRAMQTRLRERIELREKTDAKVLLQSKSLDSIISRASAEAKNNHALSHSGFSFGFDR